MTLIPLQRLGWLLALVAILSAGRVLAEEPPTLNWHRMQFAPTFILTGEARDQGFGDVLLRALAAKLPQYQHQFILAPLERVLERTGEGQELACAGALLRTPEREARMYFSDPFLTMPPNGAVIRANDRSRFEPFMKNGRLSLTQVLQTETFAIGITRNRSYGSGINALLALHAGQSSVVEKRGQSAGAVTLSDLSAQQGIDLVIAYPLEAAYWLKTSHSPVPLYFLPVAEAPDAEEPRIACSRTPQGEQAIAAINVLLADPEFRQSYLHAYADWQRQLFGLLPGAERSTDSQDSAR
jgi:uncharacterized protein (TIGR02285 family)